MALTGFKPLWKSKTFWGIVIAAVSPVLQVFGLDISKELSDTYQSAVTLVGLIVALIGRITARQVIGSPLP